MEDNASSKHEASKVQDSGKRSIDEVDDHKEIVTEGNKKLKCEDNSIENVNNVSLPEAVACDATNVHNEEKNNYTNTESKEGVKNDAIVVVSLVHYVIFIEVK